MSLQNSQRELPVLKVKSGAELAAMVTEMGYTPGELFLKCRRPYADRYTSTFRNHWLTDATSFTIEGEAERVALLHQTIPESVVSPVAMVKDGRIIAYLEEMVDGRTLRQYRNRVNALPKREAIIPGDPIGLLVARVKLEFIHLGEELVQLLHRLNAVGIGHGDAHYSNTIVSKDGRLKLIDPLAPFSPYSLINHEESALKRDNYVIAVIEHEIGSLRRDM